MFLLSLAIALGNHLVLSHVGVGQSSLIVKGTSLETSKQKKEVSNSSRVCLCGVTLLVLPGKFLEIMENTN